MRHDDSFKKCTCLPTTYSEPENLKKSRPKKKLVKANKSISGEKIMTKIHFLQFQKWLKINF